MWRVVFCIKLVTACLACHYAGAQPGASIQPSLLMFIDLQALRASPFVDKCIQIDKERANQNRAYGSGESHSFPSEEELVSETGLRYEDVQQIHVAADLRDVLEQKKVPTFDFLITLTLTRSPSWETLWNLTRCYLKTQKDDTPLRFRGKKIEYRDQPLLLIRVSAHTDNHGDRTSSGQGDIAWLRTRRPNTVVVGTLRAVQRLIDNTDAGEPPTLYGRSLKCMLPQVDAHAAFYVLSEIPPKWRQLLDSWAQNAKKMASLERGAKGDGSLTEHIGGLRSVGLWFTADDDVDFTLCVNKTSPEDAVKLARFIQTRLRAAAEETDAVNLLPPCVRDIEVAAMRDGTIRVRGSFTDADLNWEPPLPEMQPREYWRLPMDQW